MDILFKGLQFGTSEAVRVPLQHFEWRQLLGHLGDLEGTGLGFHLLNGGWVVGLVVELLHGFRFICCCCPFSSALWSVFWSRCLRGEREYLEVSCRCSCILFVIPCGVLFGLRLRFDAWLLCFTSSIRSSIETIFLHPSFSSPLLFLRLLLLPRLLHVSEC